MAKLDAVAIRHPCSLVPGNPCRDDGHGIFMSLTPSQKRYLRGLAHSLKPVILTGNKGVTPALIKEFSNALDQHELVKVKLGDDRDERKAHIAELGGAAQAELVQSIGRVACFYRRNEEQPKLALPR
jgi:RNA-binding protein